MLHPSYESSFIIQTNPNIYSIYRSIYKCPKCKNIPNIQILGFYKIVLKCKNGHVFEINPHTISSILPSICPVPEEITKCEICREIPKERNLPFYFCIDCMKPICNICIEEEKKKEKHILILYHHKNILCKEHLKVHIGYCEKCNINFCSDCEEHKNNCKEHILHFYSIYPENKSIQKFKQKIINAIYIIEEEEKKVNRIIDELKNKFNEFKQFIYNKNSLYETIIKMYENLQYNFNLIKNVREILKKEEYDWDLRFVRGLEGLGETSLTRIHRSNEVQFLIKNRQFIQNINNNEIYKNIYISNIMKIQNIGTEKKSQIIIGIYITEDKMNKDIYIINSNYNELNINNCQMFIDDKLEKYNNILCFKKKGKYTIKLQIKSELTSCENMFLDCTDIYLIDISGLYSNHIYNISHMFDGCSGLQYIEGLDFINTKSVTDMSFLFNRCEKLSEINLGKLNTSNVTNMNSMFQECHSLINIKGLNSFDVSKVNDMGFMFNECFLLSSIDLSSFHPKNVCSLNSTFRCCRSLEELPFLKNICSSNASDMCFLFEGCSKLRNVSVKGWKTKILSEARAMFRECRSIQYIEGIESLSFPCLSDISFMFENCISLKRVKFGPLKKVKNMEYLFNGCCNLNYLYMVLDFESEPIIDYIFGGVPEGGKFEFNKGKFWGKILREIKKKCWEVFEC